VLMGVAEAVEAGLRLKLLLKFPLLLLIEGKVELLKRLGSKQD